MFNTPRGKYWVSIVAFLMIIFVVSQHNYTVERLAFDEDGIWIFIIMAIWGSFYTSSSEFDR